MVVGKTCVKGVIIMRRWLVRLCDMMRIMTEYLLDYIKEFMNPIREMVIEIKPQWIKITLLVTSFIIGSFIDIDLD